MAAMNWNNATTSYTQINDWYATGTTPSSITVSVPAVDQKQKRRMPWTAFAEWIGDIVEERRHQREVETQEWIEANVLPRIAGAAPEAEIEKSVEAKKKITLKRTVGIDRDKGGPAPTPTHKGTVTLVRDLEGSPHQRSSIGIRTDSEGGSSYVEIPIDQLREAIDDLDS